MIKINKGSEPIEWTKYRLTPGVSFTPIPKLRDALLKEQGYICAYCMRRIPTKDDNSNEKSRIEHIQCQENYPHRALDYNNMVICCPGSINGDFHCDKKKSNINISFSPFDNNFVDTIYYNAKNGEIHSINSTWDKEMNGNDEIEKGVLNLNNELLKLNRKQTIEGIIESLRKVNWTHALLRKKINEYKSFNANHQLKPYCGIVIWYLNKKIRQIKIHHNE